MRIWLLVFAILLFFHSAYAIDYTSPVPAASTNLSGTIATTNTFQSVQLKNGARLGCFVQNNTAGSNSMWVYLGTCTAAAKATSIVLTGGQTFNCQSFSNVITDGICITGTMGDAFTAVFQ